MRHDGSRRRFLQGAAAACLPALGRPGPAPTDQLLEGAVFHLGGGRTTGAMALRGGRILALGPAARATAGSGTARVDLAVMVGPGRTAHVYPGFHDSHVHLLDGAFLAGCVQLAGADSQPALRERLTVHLQRIDPQGTGSGWVVGMGWRFESPSGIDLDDLAGRHPLFLVDRSGHSVLVNSAGLRAAGIDATTRDPLGGRIVRDDRGRPTGWLMESAMGLAAPAMIRAFSDADLGALLPLVLAQTARLGLTGVTEVLGSPGMPLPRPWLYTRLEAEGRLPLRIHYAVPIFALADLESVVRPLREAPRYNTERVRCVAGKLWVDGAMGNAVAWASHPEPDHRGEAAGIHYFAQQELDAIVVQAERRALPLHFHVNGDLAIESALRALERAAAGQNGRLRTRPTFVHCGFATPASRRRMRALGVVAAIQPGFWKDGFSAAGRAAYTPSARDGAYDFGALLEAGLTLAVGTDWPVVSTKDPREVLASGRTGLTPRRRALTSAEMVTGYTLGSALCAGRRDLGRLAPGCWADLTVFDGDVLETEDFHGLEVAATLVAGQPVPCS